MAEYRVSRNARRDLAEIWAHIAEHSPENADNFLQGIVKRFQLLAENPYAGRSRSDLRKHIRSFPISEYLIFHRATKIRIEIVRVVHGRRKLERLRYAE